jgi:hypothetical protein
MYNGIVKVFGFTRRLLAINYPATLQERRSPVDVHTKDVFSYERRTLSISAPSNENNA